MALNATIFGQLIAFFVFYGVCYRWVWPHLIALLDERRDKIAEGLAASERGVLNLKLAQERATEHLKRAKQQGKNLVDQAQKEVDEMLRQAKVEGNRKIETLLAEGAQQLALTVSQSRRSFQEEAVGVVLTAVQKILVQEAPTVDEAFIAEVLRTFPLQDETA